MRTPRNRRVCCPVERGPGGGLPEAHQSSYRYFYSRPWVLVAERNRLGGLRSVSRDTSSKSVVRSVAFTNIQWFLAYLLSNSSGVLKICLTDFFAVLERILLRFGTPSGIPLLTLPPTSSRCYSVLEQEAGGGSVQCVQGGVPVLLESRIGLVCSKEPSTGPSGLLSDRKPKMCTFMLGFY